VPQNQIDSALDQFLHSGKLVQNSVRNLIAESWMRCRRDGVEPNQMRAPSVSRRNEPAHCQLRDAEFVRAGLPILEEARDALSHSETIAVLADSQGIVLKTEGDEVALDAAEDLGLTPNEDRRGRLTRRGWHSSWSCWEPALRLDPRVRRLHRSTPPRKMRAC